MRGQRILKRLLGVAGGACLLLLFCPLTMATASAGGVITITALGSQGSGALFPTFEYSYTSLPAGVTLFGFPSCTTVNGATPINSALATGSYTIDGSTCSGVSASDPTYTISYVGGSFVVGSPSAAPRLQIEVTGAPTADGGIPFTYSAGFTLSNTDGPESDPVTVSTGAGGLPPEMTILSVPTPADSHWNCAGTDILAQTVSCVYTPTPGSPIPPGTSLSFDINAVMAYNSLDTGNCEFPPTAPCNFYGVVVPVGSNSADALSPGGGQLINLNVMPDGVSLNLGLSDSLGAGGSTSPGTDFTYLANVSIGENVSGAPPETQPISVSDVLPTGTILTAAPYGTGWHCSASVVATSTVACSYAPPSGGISQGTALPTLHLPAQLTDTTVGDLVTNSGQASSPDTAGATSSDTVTVASSDTTPPTVTNVSASPGLAVLGSGTTLSATVADLEAGGTKVVAAQYNINGGTWAPMAGSFGSASVNVTATIPPPTSPVADTLCVRAEDGAGNWSDGTACTSFVVYDPSAGFATGGGWINSPAGACQDLALCSDATGKGTFGFVSKYQKGATVPSGNTQYVFHEGNFNFSSSSYQWLVVNQGGTNAQFKGTGTINGQGSYQFMIWATQGSPNTFRIQVTDTVTGQTIYDSGGQILGGGSIIIHKS